MGIFSVWPCMRAVGVYMLFRLHTMMCIEANNEHGLEEPADVSLIDHSLAILKKQRTSSTDSRITKSKRQSLDDISEYSSSIDQKRKEPGEEHLKEKRKENTGQTSLMGSSSMNMYSCGESPDAFGKETSAHYGKKTLSASENLESRGGNSSISVDTENPPLNACENSEVNLDGNNNLQTVQPENMQYEELLVWFPNYKVQGAQENTYALETQWPNALDDSNNPQTVQPENMQHEELLVWFPNNTISYVERLPVHEHLFLDSNNSAFSDPYKPELQNITGQNPSTEPNDYPTTVFEGSHNIQLENNWYMPNYEIQNVQEDTYALETQWPNVLDDNNNPQTTQPENMSSDELAIWLSNDLASYVKTLPAYKHLFLDSNNSTFPNPYKPESQNITGQNPSTEPNNYPTTVFEGSHNIQLENNWLVPNNEIQNLQEDISALENRWLKALDGILELRKVYDAETTEIKSANKGSKGKNTSNTLARKEADHDKINEAEEFFKDQASTIQASRGSSRNLESSDKEKPNVELIEKFRWWVIWKIFAALRYVIRVKTDKTLRYAQFVTLPNFEEASSKLHSRRTKVFIQENPTLSNNSKLCPNVITSNCLLSSDMFGDRCSQTDLPDNFFLTFLTLLRETPIKRFRYVSYLKKGEYASTQHFYNVYMKGDHDNGDALLIAEQPQNNCLPDVSKLNEMLMIRFSNVLNIKKYTLALKQLDIKRLKLLQQWLQSNDSDITGLLNNSIFVLRIRTSIVRENYDPEEFPNLSKLLKEVLGNNAIFLEFPLRYKFPSAGIKNLGQARKLYRDIMTKHIEGTKPVGFFEEITATDFSEKIQSFIHEDIREDILTKLNVVNRPVKLTFILPFNRLLYDKIKGRLRADGPSPAIKGYKTLFKHAEKLGVAREGKRKTSFKYSNKINRAEKTEDLMTEENEQPNEETEQSSEENEQSSEENEQSSEENEQPNEETEQPSEENKQPNKEERELVPYAVIVQKWISDESSFENFLKFFTDLIESKRLSIKLSIRIDLDEDVVSPKSKIVISMDNKKEYFSTTTLEEDYKTKILRFFDDDQLDYFEAEKPK